MLVVFKIIIGLFENQLLNTGAFVFRKKEILPLRKANLLGPT